jgi:hypothetical protein
MGAVVAVLGANLGINWGPRITSGTSFPHPTLLRIVGNQLRCNVQDLLKLLKRPPAMAEETYLIAKAVLRNFKHRPTSPQDSL